MNIITDSTSQLNANTVPNPSEIYHSPVITQIHGAGLGVINEWLDLRA